MLTYKDNASESIVDIAFQETLELLDWATLCSQIATFSSTAQGKEKCLNLPIPTDIATSRSYLQETLEMGELDKLIEGGLSFQGIHDLEKILLFCIKGGFVSGEELLQVAETLRSARRLRRQISDFQIRPTLSSLLVELSTLPELQTLLESSLEEGGRIADRASTELSRLRRQLQGLKEERSDILQDLLKRYSPILQDIVIAERYERPVLCLKANAVDQCEGTVHGSSSSGNTFFVEPQQVISLGNRIAEFKIKILQEEQRLLAVWSAEVAVNAVTIRHLCGTMLRLELALTKARYGHWVGGLPPVLTEEEDSPFVIEKFRHPLLIWQQCYEGGDSVIPIGFNVSQNLKVIAITGPNTGGKTVALKSMGLAILMARSGLLLPCSGAPSLPWCSQVFADIGDEQSLQQNLSTFSGHIKRISRILDALTITSGPVVVLLDEVGAGTDPTEGSALAIALLQRLADRARLTVATTHFGELKALKYNDIRFENASVAFDSETIKPTYHLQWGIPGRSNALSIAKRLGLDSFVIDRASELIEPKGVEDVNSIIKGLEEQRNLQQAAAEDAAALLGRTELLHEELLNQWKKQRQKSQEFQDRGRQDLESSIREGQKEVRDLIKRLREPSADGEIARRTGKRLKQIQVAQKKETIIDRKGWSPKIGERVRVISINKTGEVLEISEDGIDITILCGVFRSTVQVTSIESLDGQKSLRQLPKIKVSSNTKQVSKVEVRTKKNTIDVRGLRVHEAEAVIEEKLRHTAGPLWVIHGIGTGKLKQGLLQWLSTVDYIEKVTGASQNDGGAGCSVIWLK